VPTGTNLAAAAGWFIAIVVAIPLVLWMIKRSPVGARLGHTLPGAMRLVNQVAVGQQQKVATVEVGQGEEKRWLVLGVAPGGVSLLYSLTPQEAPPAAAGSAATPAEGFQQLLNRLKNGNNKGDGSAR
jgi:flagellar protein FliO/FliZ